MNKINVWPEAIASFTGITVAEEFWGFAKHQISGDIYAISQGGKAIDAGHLIFHLSGKPDTEVNSSLPGRCSVIKLDTRRALTPASLNVIKGLFIGQN